ncbi:MAG TPA: type II toxin-antitoxin system VapB family antitoxin [Nitrospirae bacterium]|nr:type II toxin-antitoxin system VapB family antitoxin [Nitrospirota bacterium]
MRTNIVLDDELIKEAFKYSKARTKKELIHEAIKEYIETRKRKDLSKLRGKIQFKENYNYKKLRAGKN